MASRKKTKEVFIELINIQLEPHGKTYNDVLNEPEWFMNYSTTRKKEEEFISKATEILKTKLKMSESIAKKEINWFILQWGLTTAPNTEYQDTSVKIDTSYLNKAKK